MKDQGAPVATARVVRRLPIDPWKQNVMLTIASLLSILLLTLHITDDIVRGIWKAEPSNIALAVLVVVLAAETLRPLPCVPSPHS
jgi:hypothetical protein